MTSPLPESLVRDWIQRAQQQPIARAIEQIHDNIAREIDSRAPRCKSSGRCCRFEQYGHRLYTTGIEAAHTLLAYQPQSPASQPQLLPILSNSSQNPICPFLADNLCSIHTIRPAACRLFYCDPTATRWQQTLYESVQKQIRLLHDTHNITYIYTDWRTLLQAFDDLGITTG